MERQADRRQDWPSTSIKGSLRASKGFRAKDWDRRILLPGMAIEGLHSSPSHVAGRSCVLVCKFWRTSRRERVRV